MLQEEYEVFYRDTYIGWLTVDTVTGKHCYTPDKTGVEAVRVRASLLREMIEGTEGFVPPIPFFLNRIRNMKRAGIHELNYQTDYFTLREVSARHAEN